MLKVERLFNFLCFVMIAIAIFLAAMRINSILFTRVTPLVATTTSLSLLSNSKSNSNQASKANNAFRLFNNNVNISQDSSSGVVSASSIPRPLSTTFSNQLTVVKNSFKFAVSSVKAIAISLVKLPFVLISKFFNLIAGQGSANNDTTDSVPVVEEKVIVQNNKAKKIVPTNDHLSIDFASLPVEQQKLISGVTSSPIYNEKALRRLAEETGLVIDEHLVYRYFAAVNWAPTYHEKKVEQAIADTVNWRASFKVHEISAAEIKPLVASGISYVSPIPDKKKRSIIHIYMGKNIPVEPETFLKFLMYTVERADRQCVANGGSGEFVVLIDFTGFSFRNCPNMAMIKNSMTSLKFHYPHRFGKMLIINANTIFQLVWKILGPLTPKKALSKIHMVSQGDTMKILDQQLGLQFLDSQLPGGQINHQLKTDKEIESYFATGYWKHK